MKLVRFEQFCWFFFFLAVAGFINLAGGEDQTGHGWQSPNLPFRVFGIASEVSSLWACGTNEGIAVSLDGGTHWRVKHETADGNLLIDMQFVNEKFGYAAGTGGLILATEDGGETWMPHYAGTSSILQASFSDPKHGLIRTSESLLFTVDGGANWSAVSPSDNAKLFETFAFTYSLVVLNSEHMAVMLKRGSAQYEAQTLLVTSDGGKSWRTVNIPNVTLYSFLHAQDKYWAVGTEVVHKDQRGGGYAVPVALYSSDGIQWEHSTTDLSACKLEMCVACTARGCLSANGTITNIFAKEPIYWVFPPAPKLTPKWAATDSAMCFVGAEVQCSALASATAPGVGADPVPSVVSPEPLGSKPPVGPHCISCGLDQMIVDQKAQGLFTILLSLDIARNGTVSAVEAEGAPTPAIKSRIEQEARQWIFEPYVKDGGRVNLKLNTRIQINVIHPH